MLHKSSIKQSSRSLLNGDKLHKLVSELDEHKQESISGGNHIGFIPIWFVSTKQDLATLQRLQEEFATE